MKASEALSAAADLIDKGWCQGSYEKTVEGVKQYCALGALGFTDERDQNNKLEKLTSGFLGVVIPPEFSYFGVVVWNDLPGRTAGQVADELRAAASLAYGEGD